MSRRLAAILVADVVGYSRLMEADEAGTHAALKERRTLIVVPVVEEHAGRIVKFMGDGVLVEFASAANAVSCALALQREMAAANESLPDEATSRSIASASTWAMSSAIFFIYGEGVNIAARLELMAGPGGICISGIVHESLGNRIEANFVDFGQHAVKNITRPIWVWRWSGPDHEPTGQLAAGEPLAA